MPLGLILGYLVPGRIPSRILCRNLSLRPGAGAVATAAVAPAGRPWCRRAGAHMHGTLCVLSQHHGFSWMYLHQSCECLSRDCMLYSHTRTYVIRYLGSCNASGGSSEEPRGAQRSREESSGAQRRLEEPRGAHRSSEEATVAQRSPRGAQRSPEVQRSPEEPRGA